MSISKFTFLISVFFLAVSCSSLSVQTHKVAAGESFPGDSNVRNNYQNNRNGLLKILTLNVAHGRKGAINQILLDKETIQQNLREIADLLTKENVDVVALQEADSPSVWSGNFDHVDFISRQAGYPWHYSANHASSWLFNYGTAILSRWPISETLKHTFKPSPPTLNKGFMLGRMIWRPTPESNHAIEIDIVSVHLDFSRKSIREQQIQEIADALSHRNNPLIIMGDFNSEWFAERSVVKRLAEKVRMKVYEPYADNLPTYIKRGTRLDWILISNELEFVSYQVLPDIISDHLAVIAEVRLI